MSTSIKTAMVLAAGLGKRMRPLTDRCPKPLIRVASKPLIDYTLDRFSAAGVSKAVVNVHYLAEQLYQHLASRAQPEICISDERDEVLETGGALIKARRALGEAPIFCANTDAILVDEEGEACETLRQNWQDEHMDALLLLCPVRKASGYAGEGDFVLSPNGRVAWPDKRGPDEREPERREKFIFTGFQIIHPRLFVDEPLRKVSTKEFWNKAMAGGRLYGVVYDGFWMHVGDPEGLRLAEERLSNI